MKLIRLLLPALLLALPLTAQKEGLHGKWRGTNENAEGEVLEIRADGTAVSDGETLRWSHVRDGLIRIGAGGEQIDVPYIVRGDKLTLTLLEERYEYERVGKAPAPTPDGDNPLARPPAGNPLAQPAADPWARRFTGEDIALELKGSARDGYHGQLVFGGTTYPVTAKADGNQLSGSFVVGAQAFEFAASLDGDALQLTSGGTDYALKGEPLAAAAPAAPANPLAKAPAPRALTGVAKPSGNTWKHPRGWFTFEMPEGWSVAREAEEGILLNPGFGPQDSLDALIFLTYGRLDADEKNVPIDELLQKGEDEIRGQLEQQGIQVGRADGKPEKVSVGEVPGAIQTWSGRAQSGVDVEVWTGALVKRDYYLAVMAVLVGGKGDRFLPEIKRVFQTLRPTPPEPNPELAAALAGREFSHIETMRDSGAFTTIYELRAGGRVRKQMLVSGTLGGSGGTGIGGSSDETGTWEVVGDEVFLYFADGQSSGQVVMEGGQIVGLRFGKLLYRAR